jgi:hypothetical protein
VAIALFVAGSLGANAARAQPGADAELDAGDEGRRRPAEIVQELALIEPAYLQRPMELQWGVSGDYVRSEESSRALGALAVELGLSERMQVNLEIAAGRVEIANEGMSALWGVGRPGAGALISLWRDVDAASSLSLGIEIEGPSLTAGIDSEAWGSGVAARYSWGRTVGFTIELGVEAETAGGEVELGMLGGAALHAKVGRVVLILESAAGIDGGAPTLAVLPGVRLVPGVDVELGVSAGVVFREERTELRALLMFSVEHELSESAEIPGEG